MPGVLTSPVIKQIELVSLHEPINLRRLLSLLKQAKFDGGVTLNFRGGRLQSAELGRPIQVELQPESDGDSYPRLTTPVPSEQTTS